MISVILFTTLLASAVLAGSPCPPRHLIYPCSCIDTPLSKRSTFTVIVCHRLDDSNSLNYIFSALQSLQIDQFHLYDSFWEAHRLGDNLKKVFPMDWLSLLRIKEIKIVDSPLSDDFMCQWNIDCKNRITTRFTAINSSEPTTKWLCNTKKNNKYPWAGCMSRLENFQLNHGELKTVGKDFFPVEMKALTTLNLAYNQISEIAEGALKNLPRLENLDLSHNLLKYLDESMFDGRKMTALTLLDVSWNSINASGLNLWPALSSLKTFTIDHNLIFKLEKSVWEKVPESVNIINLSDNPIHCSCEMRWLSKDEGALKKVTLVGTCATPDEYKNSYLRKASIGLDKRCDENDKLRTKPIASATTPKGSVKVLE